MGCIVMIIILLVLLVLSSLFPVSHIGHAALRVMTRNEETQLIDAIQGYYAEYKKYPIPPSKQGGGVVEFGADNYLLLDILRNRDGAKTGNPLNPHGIIFLDVRYALERDSPKGGVQTSTGIWFDAWGSPYHIAIDTSGKKELNGKTPIPDFYSDVGPIQTDVIVWSYGKNGLPGGGPAADSRFSSEAGAPGKLNGSDDVVSWQ